MDKAYRRDTADVITPANENMDSFTRSFKTIEYPHHEIHDGSSYVFAEAVDQTVNHAYDIQITTPNTTKWAHFTFSFVVEAETDWFFYENVEIILAGAAATQLNRDRNNILNISGLTMAVITNTTVANANADTAVAGATTLIHGHTGDKKAGGEASGRHEFILKQNEDYSLRFVATSAGWVAWNLDWYEHTNTQE